MVQEQFIVAVLGGLLGRLPLLLVWAVGIVVAVVQWQKHSRVSALLVGGLAILLVNAVAGAVFNGYLPVMLSDGGMMQGSPGKMIAVVSVVQTLVSAIGWVFVLIAVFIARPALPEQRAA